MEYMRGIAILVTCDYGGKRLDLPATNRGSDEMRNTFEKLGYDIHERRNENATKDKIDTLLSDLYKYLQRYSGDTTNKDGSEKVIVFAFSGHGGPDKKNENKDSMSLLTHDEENLSLKGDIMSCLIGYVFEIPRLFFIDASRGKEHLHRMTINKAIIQDEGNYRIDYSTIPDHVAHSEWMTSLACTLRDEKKQSIQNVAAIVKRSIQGEGRPLKLCDSIDRLITGPLYLHPK